MDKNRARWKSDDSAWRKARREYRAKGGVHPFFPGVPYQRPLGLYHLPVEKYKDARANLWANLRHPVGYADQFATPPGNLIHCPDSLFTPEFKALLVSRSSERFRTAANHYWGGAEFPLHALACVERGMGAA